MDANPVALSRYRGIKTEIAYPEGYGSAAGIMITHTPLPLPRSSIYHYLNTNMHSQHTDSPIKIPS